MGYYTRFALNIEPYDNKIVEKLESEYEDIYNCAVEDSDTHKWYSHEEDMRKMSLENPEYLFILNGEGEESGDIWVEYYKAGKMQRAEAMITFEAYDEKKLM